MTKATREWRHYHRFIRIGKRLSRISQALFMAGFIGFVIVSFSSGRETMNRNLTKVFALTVVPGFLFWIFLHGFALIWGMMLGRRLKAPRVLLGVLLVTGVSFLTAIVWASIWTFRKSY